MAHRKDGKIWIDGLETQFTGQSLSSLDLLETERNHPTVPVLPELHVVKIGGQSILDAGRDVVYPVVEVLGRVLESKKVIFGTGGGVRSRHVFSIGLDLGLPTGVLAD